MIIESVVQVRLHIYLRPTEGLRRRERKGPSDLEYQEGLGILFHCSGLLLGRKESERTSVSDTESIKKKSKLSRYLSIWMDLAKKS